MDAQVSFWDRISRMFRSSTNGHGQVGEVATLSETDHTTSPTDTSDTPVEDSTADASTTGDVTGDNASHDSGAGWSLTPRTPNKKQLAENYSRVADLLDNMHAHLERQDARAEALTESVQRVAASLQTLGETQQDQSSCLRTIADRVEKADKHAAKLAHVLDQMPDSLNAQSEAVRSLGRQIEISQEADHRVAESLRGLGQAMDSLRSSAATQVDALREIHHGEADQREALRALIREQSKRFTVVIVIATVLSLGALGAMVATLLMVLNR